MYSASFSSIFFIKKKLWKMNLRFRICSNFQFGFLSDFIKLRLFLEIIKCVAFCLSLIIPPQDIIKSVINFCVFTSDYLIFQINLFLFYNIILNIEFDTYQYIRFEKIDGFLCFAYLMKSIKK